MIDNQARVTIDNIQKEIEASKGTHIWSDYVNALKLVSQVVFTRSSGFILELLQNAEDSGLGLQRTGAFEVKINNARLKVIHNGRSFSENDAKSLCGIRSSKKPETGTLGYLGIGFKSVFKATDRPEIYSNGFQFKFDRSHWPDSSKTPWHVIPIWIDEPSEPIDNERTTFIIPFREEGYYSRLAGELQKLKTELYLFLRWIHKIEVTDEVTGRTWVLENSGSNSEDITILKHDSKEQRFKFFRRTLVNIPEWVKQDRLTQDYRANVTKRDIAIAFALDSSGNLAPSEAGAMYGGVYSFLPLGEAKSGAKFPIQADFLVQPGRDAINYEAAWNHWLLGEVESLCEKAIIYFSEHPQWKYQFLPAFEFTKSNGNESFEKLFGPKLITPIEQFLEHFSGVPTTDNTLAKLDEVVRLAEDQKASDALVSMGILTKEQLAPVMGGSPDLKLASPDVKDTTTKPIKRIDRHDLLSNTAFLEEKARQPDGPKWFKNLYLWLHANSRVTKNGRKWVPEGYWSQKIVLTADNQLLEGGKVYICDSDLSAPMIRDLAIALQASKPMLHPSVLTSAENEEERKTIKGFLTSRTGVQILDSAAVCREALLPKILSNATKPSIEDLLKYTAYVLNVLGEEVPRGSEIWVLTKEGDIRTSRELLLPSVFKPEQDWEPNQRHVAGINFVSERYIDETENGDELDKWRKFFKACGIKSAPDNGIQEFAVSYAKEKLEKAYAKVTPVEKRNYGYDMVAETSSGSKVYVEVKGQRPENDVELTDNETDAADMHKDDFYLCVLSYIPENPTMYMVQNPAAPGVGKKAKLTIPVNIWKAARWLK